MNEAAPALPDLDALRASGAAQLNALEWHYIETLARRTQAQSGTARVLLHAKLQEALKQWGARTNKGAHKATQTLGHEPPSPLATLLQDMGRKTATHASGATQLGPTENPRIEQFKKQLNQISVQKQVSQAIAQAPQNAGPINSHMLVLRSLGLMRDISPDYLNRFMAHVDTLFCLEDADKGKPAAKKAAAAKKNP